MKTMLIAALAVSFSIQGTPVKVPISALVGQWETTVVSAPGSAPTFAPITIQARNGKVFVTKGSSDPLEAVVFSPRGETPEANVALLIVRSPASATAAQTVLIEPIRPGELRYEWIVEFNTPGRANLYASELFRKVK